MAKYESKGYCPNNEFINYSLRGFEESESSKVVRETLGDIPAYMVYEPLSLNPKGCYITEVLLNTKYLGVKIAALLKYVIPVCVYPQGDTIILIKDCINPDQITGMKFQEEGYVVGLKNEGDITRIEIYKE